MSKTTSTLKVAALLTVAGLSITACQKKSENTPVPAATFLQVIHASPKTAEVTINVNEKKYQQKTTYLSSLNSYGRLEAGKDLPIKLSMGSNVVANGKFSFENGAAYSLFIYDTLTNNKVKFVILKDMISNPGTTKANIRFLHLSPNTPPVDIDVFSGNDSIRLVKAGAYIGNSPDVTALAPFKTIITGKFRVKVKTMVGNKIVTLLDIPSLELSGQKTYTLFLKGVNNGSSDAAIGLQLWMHK
ncbi:MAG: DUF4397 domain-containing protein [Chitinophaga sp.]|uniref:DUF4397 domain-containing protein n=1 Tax=Chitinophaga sp. TaxID=1869181 RepID=UPI001AFFA220|nr:DUF4397 domain-containing protein [Chitinophaga sp.]MBO9729819.1 DUF4397 domain-containing protein [Chitinophaga sp.]